MKEYTRNVAVGLTVLVALALLAGLIVMFAGLPSMFRMGYELTLQAEQSHAIEEGDAVHFAGLRVGKVIDVRFTDPANPSDGVSIVTLIDGDIKLPGNTKAVVIPQQLVGSPYVALAPEGEPKINPDTGKPYEYLPRDDSAVLVVQQREGSGVIPAELTEAMGSISKLADNLNELIAPSVSPTTGPSAQTTQPADPQEPPAGLQGTVARLNRTLDAIHGVMGDVENQANIKKTLANLTDATDKATEAMDALKQFATDARKTAATADETLEGFRDSAAETSAKIDKLLVGLIDDADEIGKLMSELRQAAGRLNAADGTAGKLLNDPELYNNLVDATRRMSVMMKDFQELIKEWKAGGVEIKLR